jgi:hypothetical protein
MHSRMGSSFGFEIFPKAMVPPVITRASLGLVNAADDGDVQRDLDASTAAAALTTERLECIDAQSHASTEAQSSQLAEVQLLRTQMYCSCNNRWQT